MEYLCVGKLVNTHGIKGEVRLLSRFRHKDKVFVKGFKFYIGKDKKEYEALFVTINCAINTRFYEGRKGLYKPDK